MTIANRLSGFQSEADASSTRLNLHLLKSVTAFNAVELWAILNELEMRPASVFGIKMIVIDGFSSILSSSM
jgi:hypothetical protein